MTYEQAKKIWRARLLGWLAFIVAHLVYGFPAIYLGIRDDWKGPVWFYIWGIGAMVISYYFPLCHRIAKRIIERNGGQV